jgi:6-phosphogluconolactonase
MSRNKNYITEMIAAAAVCSLLLTDCGTPQSQNVYMYIGSYASPENPGLYVYSYDENNLQLNEVQRLTGHANPSFLAIHPSGNFLYAVNETADYEGKKEGSVSAFTRNRETGQLEYLNRQSSHGAHPCHVSLLSGGSQLVVANYSGGNIALYPLASDGLIDEASQVIQHEGSGPVEGRQAGPHAHSVFPSPDGNYVFAADLGIDKVMIYRIDKESGQLIPNQAAPWAEMPPGSGPRHLDFHPNGRWIYVVNELNSTVTRLEFNRKTGEVAVNESVTTLPDGWDGRNSCADIHVHPSGKFLFASNRGHNSIAIFSIGNDGHIKPSGQEPVRGETPRNFCLDPKGKRMFVANQRSGNITIFDIDQDSGELTFTEKGLKIDQPVCIKFLSD